VPDEPAADADVRAWRNALRSAYSSNSYLSGRNINLSLLEELGKNAWLISNSQLDELLKAQERELERLKKETESVNNERRDAQEQSRGELQALEETWKQGIRRLVEVQLATGKLHQEIQARNTSDLL
jgi:pre-mRNA-splicing factor SPF27